MDEIASGIKIICLISILTGILSAVIPGGGIKKAFSTLCAVVMICVIVSPFSTLSKGDFDLNSFSPKKKSEELKKSERTAEIMLYEKILSDALEKNLIEKGIDAVVDVSASKNGEDMRVDTVIVTGTFENGEKEEIEAFLNKSFAELTVVFREENDG